MSWSTEDSAEPRSRARVLVVDDRPANVELVRGILELEGHEAIVFSSGEAALAHPGLGAIDVALLDVRMPGMDGFELLARLRARPELAGTPVVFLTAHGDVELHERALASGVDDFLVKPVRATELLIRVRALAALRRTRLALEQSVVELSRRNDELLRAQSARRALATLVLHDLKNPIQLVGLGVHFLGQEELSDDGRQILGSIEEGSSRLKTLVQDLLDVERSEDGALVAREETIAIEPVLEALRLLHSVRRDVPPLALAIEEPAPLVRGDEELLRRVLANLVDNATRYSPKDQAVSVAVRREDDDVCIRVRDRGPGIAPADRERIFGRYVQLEGRAAPAARGGHGLGLAFCRLAVTAMHGRIQVEEGEDGVGTVFDVRLPSARTEEPSAA